MFNKSKKEKFIQSAYRASFLAPASRYRHWRERCGMPRPRWPWGGKTLRARYTVEELEAGCHTVNVGPYTGSDAAVAAGWTGQLLVENKPLTDDTLLWHVSAPDERRGKSWLLTHYGPDALLDAFYIDIDLHFCAGWNYVDETKDICVHVPESSSEEVEATKTTFWDQVAQIQAISDRLGMEPMWITSPGDMWREQHLQGLHVWFRLEQPLPREELAARMACFAVTNDIRGELFPCRATSQNPELLDRAVRLPGQPYQYLVDVNVAQKTISRMCPDNDYVSQFMTVVDKWQSISCVSLSLIAGIEDKDRASISPPPSPPKYMSTPPVPPPGPGEDGWQSISCVPLSVLPVVEAADGVSLSPPPSPTKYMSTPPLPPPRPGEEVDRGDTLDLIRQVTARVVRSYGGRADRAAEIEHQVAKEVRRLVNRSSTTCDTPGLLERKVRPVVEFYLAEYDPAKAARRTIRLEDGEVTRPLQNVSTDALVNVLGSRGVSDRVISFLANLLPILIVQHGRVAVRRRSRSTSGTTLADLAGSRRQWDRIRGEVQKLVKVVERGRTGTCSLITLADDLLAEVAACTFEREERKGAV